MSKVVGHSCPHCGAPLPASVRGATFCPFCGSTVTLSSEGQALNPRKLESIITLDSADNLIVLGSK